MNTDVKILVRRTLIIAFFIPLFMILIAGLAGTTLHEVMYNSLIKLTVFPNSLYILLPLIFIDLLVVFKMRPIFAFWKKYKSGEPVSMIEKNRVMNSFNALSRFITVLTVAGFVIGNAVSNINSNNSINILPNVYIFVESAVTGLLTSVFVIMSLENVLFPVKAALMIDPPIIKPHYKSFYKQLTTTIVLLLTFLGFQIFSIAAEFYTIAFERARELLIIKSVTDMDIKPEMFFTKIGIGHKQTEELLDVSGIKILLYFILSLRLIALLKKTIKNPLKTVEGRLDQLSSDMKFKQNKITIVNNDEFSCIYGNINKLILKKQEELHTSQKRLHTIVDNAADPIISFNENGDIFIFNPAAEKLFGWKRSEIYGTSFSTLFDENEEHCINCGSDNRMFVRAVTDQDNQLQRYTGQKRDGTRITFETNFSNSDTPEGIIHTVIIRDVSKQLEFENSLRTAKVAAEKANELKSEFLANMSHELRTPLNAVLGFTQLLNTDKNLTDDQIDKLNIISRSGEHLLALINDILDISKIEAGKIDVHESVFNLREFTEDLKQMLDLKCSKKGLALYVEYVEPLPEFVRSDLGKLRQIMINILGNAIKFTKEGGISVVVGVENNQLRFSVNDTGKGIPESEIESILQPFTQSSITDNEGGTGLGLAITNSFINMMGGKLDIESIEDTGSTFSFGVDFEYAQQTKEVGTDLGTVIGIEGDRHPEVIIVDDKINNRLILKEMLESVGFITIEAKNGLEAVEKIRELKPEMVFMDIKMPIMDGYAAVKAIKSDDYIKDIPVFALTASAFKHDEKSILNSGFDGFLAKPFKLSSLFNLVHEKSDIKFIYEAVREIKKNVSTDNLDIPGILKALTMENLEFLDEMALINDFAGINTLLKSLGTDPVLSDFIESVIYLTDNFDDDNLQQLIQKIKDAG